MKIRLQKETNHIKGTTWYNIEKYNGSYWENVYSTMESNNAHEKFEKLKLLGSETTKEILQEFEKKVPK
jgi:CYTH domain-containing protein